MSGFPVYCADIGSVKAGSFGWASNGDGEGCDIADLVSGVASDLRAGAKVALGFECPLYVPLRTDAQDLTKARPGENGHPWSAGAGIGSLGVGLVEIPWILRQIEVELGSRPSFHLDWEAFAEDKEGVFFWEAFIAGKQKGADHLEDANIAVEAFLKALPNPRSALTAEPEVHSLIGAVLLRAGWTQDLSVLSEPCLVVRPS